MTCEEVQLLIPDYIDHELSDLSRYAFDTHLKSCESCKHELEQQQYILDCISDEKDIIPEKTLRKKFNAMLLSELNLQATENIIEKDSNSRIFSFRSVYFLRQLVAACIILFTGILIGTLINKSTIADNSVQQLSDMKKDLKDMKETMLFTLLKNESASERIKAVGFAEEMPHPNKNILEALVNTLNNDKNVNVRLAALYSLNKFSDDTAVRDSLVQSLARQTEPIIQVVLINMLTEKDEVKAIEPIRDIMTKANTRKEVKEIARKALRVL